MTEPARGAWRCPSCGRSIPRTVDVCRCGSERRRLEAMGYKFDAAPMPSPAMAAPRRQYVENYGPATAFIGYRIDTDLGAGWRVLLKGFFAAATIAVSVVTVRVVYSDPLPTRGNIQVLTTHEDFTRGAGPDSGNTIPAFLASAGRAGALATSGLDDDPVRDVSHTELGAGFCSQSVARQVRHEYPGYYENWSDERLARTVLEKHPDYENRLCTLSIRLDASANEIIKYELKPRSILSHAGLVLATLLVAMAFAVACLNVYYRVIIGRLVSAAV